MENNNHKLEDVSLGYTENNNLIARSNVVTLQNGVNPSARKAVTSDNVGGAQQFGSKSETGNQHHHLAVQELSATFDGLGDQFSPIKNDALTQQRLYEAQRDLSPLYQKQTAGSGQEHKHSFGNYQEKSAQSFGMGLDTSQVKL